MEVWERKFKKGQGGKNDGGKKEVGATHSGGDWFWPNVGK